MILAEALVAGGALGMAFSFSWMLIIFTVIFSIGYGSVWSLYATCASDFFSKESPGGVIGLWTAYSGIGSIMGPIIAGFAADQTGTLVSAFLVSTAAGILSLVLLIPMLKEKTLMD
jgi:MFS transporter, OFA family, oxalate/formate antiporter